MNDYGIWTKVLVVGVKVLWEGEWLVMERQACTYLLILIDVSLSAGAFALQCCSEPRRHWAPLWDTPN